MAQRWRSIGKDWRVIAALVVWLWLPSSVWGGFDEGVAAYERGDYATARRVFQPLAEQGNAEAQSYLGRLHFFDSNDTEAARWFRLAAAQGHAGSQWFLGLLYASGHGVPQDYTEAAKWYRLAAEQDLPYAQWELGVIYANGKGVPQDYVQAHLWLNLAASGLPPGKDQEKAAKARDIVAARMPPAQVAEAQRLAREWRKKHP